MRSDPATGRDCGAVTAVAVTGLLDQAPQLRSSPLYPEGGLHFWDISSFPDSEF